MTSLLDKVINKVDEMYIEQKASNVPADPELMLYNLRNFVTNLKNEQEQAS